MTDDSNPAAPRKPTLKLKSPRIAREPNLIRPAHGRAQDGGALNTPQARAPGRDSTSNTASHASGGFPRRDHESSLDRQAKMLMQSDSTKRRMQAEMDSLASVAQDAKEPSTLVHAES